ncbi:MAG: 6-phosphogluconolactonase [Betaproteobacteria bacterium]|nr:6-phosphogluconolactonase [Betaproteobacteria bacterium]MDH3435676.1 6-phosphogluconolactonase [Betaproteobacteria bacterium]
MTRTLRRFETASALASAAAALFSEAACEAVEARGRFCVVLPGGRTPTLLFAALREAPWAGKVPWHDSHFFWSDERCLPADHPDSNYGLARRELLTRVSIPAGHVHRAPTEISAANQAAAAWEHALREFFGAGAHAPLFPEFDLVVLGIGADGHTASLFPGDPALEISERWVAAVAPSGTPPVARLTLTLPVFNHARRVMFLGAGPDKRQVMDAIATGNNPAAARFPAARVSPRGQLIWLYTEAPL